MAGLATRRPQGHDPASTSGLMGYPDARHSTTALPLDHDRATA